MAINEQLLGLCSYAFRHAVSSKIKPMKAENFIREAAAFGFRRVLLCENLNYDQGEIQYYKKLKKILLENKTIAETGMRGIAVKLIEKHIEIAKELESPLLRLVIGESDDNTPEGKEKLKNQTIEALEKIIIQLEKNNLILGIENHFDLSTDELCNITDHFNSRHIALIYDSTNGTGLLEKPLETLEKMNSRIISAHIKNYAVKKVEGGYFLAGTDLPDGELDIKKLLNKVQNYNPACSIIFEYNIKPEKTMEENDLLAWEKERIMLNYEYLKSM